MTVAPPTDDALFVDLSDQVIDAYLQSLRITIWGRGIDIQSEAGRARAVASIRKLLKGLCDTAASLAEADE